MTQSNTRDFFAEILYKFRIDNTFSAVCVCEYVCLGGLEHHNIGELSP